LRFVQHSPGFLRQKLDSFQNKQQDKYFCGNVTRFYKILIPWHITILQVKPHKLQHGRN